MEEHFKSSKQRWLGVGYEVVLTGVFPAMQVYSQIGASTAHLIIL